jgi:hypothetical protein
VRQETTFARYLSITLLNQVFGPFIGVESMIYGKPKSINARMTILASGDGVSIEIKDDDSSSLIMNIKMTPEQWCKALGRLCYVPAESAELYATENVGKTLEVDKYSFQIPDDVGYAYKKEFAKTHCFEMCPEGWRPDGSFDSQGSFYKEEGKSMARDTMRRWVAKGETK